MKNMAFGGWYETQLKSIKFSPENNFSARGIYEFCFISVVNSELLYINASRLTITSSICDINSEKATQLVKTIDFNKTNISTNIPNGLREEAFKAQPLICENSYDFVFIDLSCLPKDNCDPANNLLETIKELLLSKNVVFDKFRKPVDKIDSSKVCFIYCESDNVSFCVYDKDDENLINIETISTQDEQCLLFGFIGVAGKVKTLVFWGDKQFEQFKQLICKTEYLFPLIEAFEILDISDIYTTSKNLIYSPSINEIGVNLNNKLAKKYLDNIVFKNRIHREYLKSISQSFDSSCYVFKNGMPLISYSLKQKNMRVCLKDNNGWLEVSTPQRKVLSFTNSFESLYDIICPFKTPTIGFMSTTHGLDTIPSSKTETFDEVSAKYVNRHVLGTKLKDMIVKSEDLALKLMFIYFDMESEK